MINYGRNKLGEDLPGYQMIHPGSLFHPHDEFNPIEIPLVEDT